MFGRIYNRYDYAVRFSYCKIPLLRDVFRKFFSGRLYHSVDGELDKRFAEMRGFLDEHGLDIRNRTVLEVGPGDSTILASRFLESGAGKYIMVDKFPRMSINSPVLESDKVHFLMSDITNLRDIEPNSVDLIVGVNVLEHIKHVKKAFLEMRRVLKPLGLIIQYVDMRDHYNFNKPLKFLKYSNFAWNTFLTQEGYSYTNRLRIDDYINIVRGTGNLEILRLVESNTDESYLDKITLNERFRGKDKSNLSVLQAVLVAGKRGELE